MTEGMVGYFPEGTPYGPSESDGPTLLLLLQFGGPSGSGYLSEQEQTPIISRLKGTGTFNDGVYTYNDETSKKHNKDGYEAMWEAAKGRKLQYPAPRYCEPVFMHPSNFHWLPADDKQGIKYMLLGSFSERQTRIGFLRVKAGSAASLSDNSIHFVIQGCGSAGTSSWSTHSAIRLDFDEVGKIEALEDSELLHLGLPDLRELSNHEKHAAATTA